MLAAARDEAAASLDGARQEAGRLVEEAQADARRAGESERVQVEGEVQALLARRDFLESDVDHLEQYLVAQRERIIEAVASLTDLVQRVPGGLADMRRPLLSAAAEPTATTGRRRAVDESDDDDDDPFAVEDAAAEERSEIAEITKVAEAGPPTGRRHAAVGRRVRCSTRTASRPSSSASSIPATAERRRPVASTATAMTRPSPPSLRKNGTPAASSLEPNGSGPSSPAETSGAPLRRGASRVVPRSPASSRGFVPAQQTSAGAEP